MLIHYSIKGDVNMDTLYAKMKEIVQKKSVELKKWEEKDPGAIDCPILECEINDAEYIMLVIKADMPKEHKLSGIKAIYLQTTSGSIYDAVQIYFKEEGVSL
jgi:hypothetical protein